MLSYVVLPASGLTTELAAYDYRCGALDEENNEVVDAYKNMLCVSRFCMCFHTVPFMTLMFGHTSAVTPRTRLEHSSFSTPFGTTYPIVLSGLPTTSLPVKLVATAEQSPSSIRCLRS